MPHSLFHTEVLEGLSQPQKSLSPKWLYDDRGSALFEEITTAPEYYPTRTEAAIFRELMPLLSQDVPVGGTIIEYGSGASVKTVELIKALSPTTYMPLDIAADFLHDAAARLATMFPATTVKPVVADFTDPAQMPSLAADTPSPLGFFPGSTIGNLSPAQRDTFLAGTRAALGDESQFLVGADLIKDTAVLEAAYDDAGGITAAFNLNLLTRMNRELGMDFDPTQFDHRAIFNEAASRIEMHLVARTDQSVHLAGQRFSFHAGETLHTENSYKFTIDAIQDLATQTGWRLRKSWTDPKDWFGVFLLEATPA